MYFIAHIGKTIWGHGNTAEAALKEAHRWVDEWNTNDNWRGKKAKETEPLQVLPATEELGTMTDACGGGSVKWKVVDDVAVYAPRTRKRKAKDAP